MGKPLFSLCLFLFSLVLIGQKRHEQYLEEYNNQLTSKGKDSLSYYASQAFLNRNQLDTAGYYARLLFESAEKEQNKKNLALANYTLGAIAVKSYKFSESKEYLRKALESNFFDDYQDLTFIAIRIRIWQSINYFNTYHYTESLNLLKETLNICLDTNKVMNDYDRALSLSYCYGNIANVLQTQGDYNQAKNAQHKALKYSKSIRDTFCISQALESLGNLHLLQQNSDSAITLFKKCTLLLLNINENEKYNHNLARVYKNIGAAYCDIENTIMALEYLQLAMEIWEKLKYDDGIAEIHLNIGELLNGQKKYKKALEHFNEAKNLTKKLDLLQKIARGLSITYEKLNDFKNAYYSYDSSMQIKNSLLNKNLADSARIIIAEFELQIEKIKSEKLIFEQKELLILLLLLAGSSFIIISLLFALYFVERDKRKASDNNKVLQLKNEVQELRIEKGFGSEKDVEIIVEYILKQNNNRELTIEDKETIEVLLKHPLKENKELADIFGSITLEGVKKRIEKLRGYLNITSKSKLIQNFQNIIIDYYNSQ